MSSVKVLIGVSVLSTSVAILSLWRDAPEAPPPPPPPLSATRLLAAPDRALDRKISALADEVDALWEAQDEVASGAAQRDVEVQDREDAPVSAEEQTSRMRQTFAAALGAQSADPDWAPDATADLEDGLHRLGDRLASVDRVECRATMCVVEFVYEPDRADPSELADALAQLAPWPANVVSSINTTPDHQGWLYLSREGHGLPPV